MNKFKKFVVLQHDQKDCGCACLKSVLRYNGSDANLEHLKELSGTTSKGTSMLGLIETSEKFGLKSRAFEASIENLKNLKEPCILHVEMENGFLHYLTCFGFKNGYFLISDPAIGFQKYTSQKLLNVWKKGYLLTFEKTTEFKKSPSNKNSHFKWLLTIIKEDTSFYISAVFLGVIIAFLSMVTLVFTEKLVDVILPSRDRILLYKSLASWAILLLLIIGLNYIRSKILIKQAYRFNTRIIRYFFNKLLFMPKVFFDSKKQGDMIARMNDTERLQQNVKTIIADSFIELAMIALSFSFLMYYATSIALLVLVALPILYLSTYIFNDKIKNLQHKMFANYALTEANYIDSINGIETIKSFGKEKYYSKKNIKIYAKFQNYIALLQQTAINQTVLTNISGTIITISGIIYAVILVFEHKIQTGDMIAIISLILMFIGSIKEIVQLNFDIFESKIALERMFDFVERSNTIEEEEKSQKYKIESIENITIKDLSFAYAGQDFLIKKGNLKLKKGKITTLIGRSGSGKSSLLQLLLKFYKKNTGNITINNSINFANITTNSWIEKIAYVPQNIKIFNTDLLNNISLDENVNENEIISFCKDFGFDYYFENFQESYWTLLGEEGINVSGGERQLIALARALFSKPQVLLLDEVSASMDEKTEAFVLEIISKIKSESLILFITHKKKLVHSVSDYIYLLENKEIIRQ
ncbi:MAG TPA: ATP-binding cassette domain-containing protein [Bacteroidia bacterium]|nr:ATP-binding cassette domain-containing protein [Bacteroidia bacterium]